MTDPATHRPVIGVAQFGSATFNGDATFESATFNGDASFDAATFNGDAQFHQAAFAGHAKFREVEFGGVTDFGLATFEGVAAFSSAAFAGETAFRSTTFAGMAAFDSTIFVGDAVFDSATFNGEATFRSATFTWNARFSNATFAKGAHFSKATFAEVGRFSNATFTEVAWFDEATFTGGAWFDEATFIAKAWFTNVAFKGNAWFEAATFAQDARFNSSVFERTAFLGPLTCAGKVGFFHASFAVAVTLEIAAKSVSFRRTRWAQPATVWLRYADTDLSDAVAEYPVTIACRPRPFIPVSGSPIDESILAGLPTDQVRVTSLRGVDAVQLVLTDLDLSGCLFAGTVHLDQLRIEGDCRFSGPPAGVHRRGRLLLVRYTRRNTLAEEHHWRHTRPWAGTGWEPPSSDGDVTQPRALAAVYRALRKSYEDSSNEPGAADFYYGEMEMRRADSRTAPAERGLITAYWALSGYGLRAARATGWLLLAMALTMLVMMLWGLPQRDTPSLTTGTVAEHRVTMTTNSPDPENPVGPPGDRLTSARFEKSLRIVVNSVIFRASGQSLTTAGTYTEMASRLTEPVLLGLALLAVRGRIKR
ncbi:pentapeptide repeat-containing protein [Streptomyces sp. NPDC020917]|uniref:pentapeptide repeat-containing protein n=1 Tax=Streptomyces sp. NPDC020917 TaxID=3365102 RepID=UPI0037B04714